MVYKAGSEAGWSRYLCVADRAGRFIKKQEKRSKMLRKSLSSPTALRGVLALLLFICLVECTTGSCLSYGHSCWGAHGKRSGKAPASAPDWYITRILRRMAANNDLNNSKNLENRNNDIYQVDADDTPNKFVVESEVPTELGSRGQEAKPMLDEELLSNMKFWQIMRAAAEDN